MKNFILTIAFTLLAAMTAAAGVTVAVTPATGTPGERVTVGISMTNTEPVYALQLSIRADGLASAVDAATEGRASVLRAQAGIRDGILNIMLFSTAMEPIAPGEGTVARVTLDLGSAPCSMTRSVTVKATDADGNTIASSAGDMTTEILAPLAEYPGGKAYDYGRVPIRSVYNKDIPVKNNGTAPLVITGLSFSDPTFASDTGLPATIAPGTTGNLHVVYSPVERGAASATVTIQSNNSTTDNTLRLLAAPYAVNEVYIGSAKGRSDTEVTVPIRVANMDDITGFTIEIELPAHFRYVDGSFNLTDRAADHGLSVALKGNRLHATAYSITDTPFKEHDGTIAEFRLALNGRDSKTLIPAKAVLSAMIGGAVENVTSDVYGGTVSVTYPSINVASSLSLGRTPITESARKTLTVRNNGSEPLTIQRAETDGLDLEIDELPLTIPAWGNLSLNVSHSATVEGSLSGRLTLYSDDPDHRVTHIMISADRYAPNALTFTQKEHTEYGAGTIMAGISNYDALNGFQFDIHAPQGFTIGTITPTGRATSYSISQLEVDGAVRVFAYSLSDTPIEPGDGDVLEIPFTFDGENTPSGIYTFGITDVKLSDANMANRHSTLGSITPTFTVLDIPAPIHGDLNSDRVVDVKDVKILIQHIIYPENSTLEPAEADMDGNGEVNVNDVKKLIQIIIEND